MTMLKGLKKLRSIKAVVFDMDGTLCLPQPWMFPAMRQAIGLDDKSMDILTFIDNLPTEIEREDAHSKIQEVERKAMNEMEPQPGLIELLEYLTLKGYSKNICTRNVIKPVNYLISSFIPAGFSKFDYIVTRDFRPTKPNPDPLLYIAQKLDLKISEILMVGDSFDDMKSGRSAGCTTVLLKNHVNGSVLVDHKDLVDSSIDSLIEIITMLGDVNIEIK